jgi:phosphoribosyl-ATP pyrophosphohydrolase/phosphoribosyl-AMP cyclohydrolase
MTPEIHFPPEGLLPAIVQDKSTGRVLMLGYMNESSLRETLSRRRVVFWSRSRNRLWEKGETSGNGLLLEDLRVDCDGDAILVLASPLGPTCHTGLESCFDTSSFGGLHPGFEVWANLGKTVRTRWDASPEGSYVASLLKAPPEMSARKVVEEACEVLVEMVKVGNEDALRGEWADLLFHIRVAMERSHVSFDEVMDVLDHRTGKGGIVEKASRDKKGDGYGS